MDKNTVLREMGLGPVWRLRRPQTEEASSPPTPPLVAEVPNSAVSPSDIDWSGLAGAVTECRACALCAQRKQALLGVGDVSADWLFVGTQPAAEDDEHGAPFAGQAGTLLDNMLAAIELRRGRDVYLTTAVKCCPSNSRAAQSTEFAACLSFLERQVSLIKPKLIVALGEPAAQALLVTDTAITGTRGRVHEFRGIPLIVTYHPAQLLSNPPDKAKAWEDLLFMRRTMRSLKEKV